MPNISELATQIWPFLAGKVREMIRTSYVGPTQTPKNWVGRIETDSGTACPSWAQGVAFTGAGVTVGATGSTVTFTATGEIEIPYGSSPLNVSGSTWSAGSSASVARIDHQHGFAATSPATLTPGAIPAEGTSTCVARADHVHGVLTGIAAGLGATSTNTEGNSASLARADHTHDLAVATSASLAFNVTSAEGSSASLARADHVHALFSGSPRELSALSASAASSVIAALPLLFSSVTASTANTDTEGTSSSFARADHQHVVPTATPAASSVTLTAALGTSASFSRSDHVHALSTAIDPFWSGVHTFAGTGTRIVNAGDYGASMAYTTSIGAANKRLLAIYAAELNVESLVSASTLGVLGGRLLVPPAMSELTASLGTADTTLYAKHNSFAASHVLLMESSGSFEALLVTAGPVGAASPYSYTVTRNFDGSGGNTWQAGTAIVSTGKAGAGGWLELYAKDGLYSASSTTGPTIVGNCRSGSEYNAWITEWAIGNLKGLYDYGSTSAMGAAFGNSACTWISIDEASGLRIKNSTASRVRIDATGASFQGAVVSSSIFSGYINGGSIVGTTITAGCITGASIRTASLLGTASPGTKIDEQGISIQAGSTFSRDATLKFLGHDANQKADLYGSIIYDAVPGYEYYDQHIILDNTNYDGYGMTAIGVKNSASLLAVADIQIYTQTEVLPAAGSVHNHADLRVYTDNNSTAASCFIKLATGASESSSPPNYSSLVISPSGATFDYRIQAARGTAASRGGIYIPLNPVIACSPYIGASLAVGASVLIVASTIGLPASVIAVDVRLAAKWTSETAASISSLWVGPTTTNYERRFLFNSGGIGAWHENNIIAKPTNAYGDFGVGALSSSCGTPLCYVHGYYL